jgi:hypothetical protein
MSKLEIVSNLTEQDVKANRARDEAVRALQALTGNLLRIVRGAGKPYELDNLAVDYVLAHRAYYEAAGQWLGDSNMHIALDVCRDGYVPGDDSMSLVLTEAFCSKEDAIQASLQVAASRILGDSVRESRGKSDLMKAMQRWAFRGSVPKKIPKS